MSSDKKAPAPVTVFDLCMRLERQFASHTIIERIAFHGDGIIQVQYRDAAGSIRSVPLSRN